MTVISQRNAEHYVWGDHCDGWHLFKGRDLHVIRESVPPGGSEKRHCHAIARQVFFILSGQAVMELDGEEHLLTPGDAIHIPPGRPHQFRNPFDGVVEFLVVSSPSSHGDRTDLG